MISNTDLVKHLNLLRTSKRFVMREIGDSGEAEVFVSPLVRSATGMYWMAGTTALSNGREIESVFHVDTDAGGELLATYWWIDDQWFKHDDKAAYVALGLTRKEVFPFDWRFAVPLEVDVFHDELSPNRAKLPG